MQTQVIETVAHLQKAQLPVRVVDVCEVSTRSWSVKPPVVRPSLSQRPHYAFLLFMERTREPPSPDERDAVRNATADREPEDAKDEEEGR